MATYSANKRPKAAAQAQMTFGLFTQEDGKPFTLISPELLAVAVSNLIMYQEPCGHFGNNLACLRCGRCALVVRRCTYEDGYVECGKCGTKERFLTRAAADHYVLTCPEKVRRSHQLGLQEDREEEFPPARPARIELPVLTGLALNTQEMPHA